MKLKGKDCRSRFITGSYRTADGGANRYSPPVFTYRANRYSIVIVVIEYAGRVSLRPDVTLTVDLVGPAPAIPGEPEFSGVSCCICALP